VKDKQRKRFRPREIRDNMPKYILYKNLICNYASSAETSDEYEEFLFISN
jgi:hypothetical protein